MGIALTMIEWAPLILSLKLAFVTTLLLLLIGIPAAYFLAHTRSRFRPISEALISLPLVLPPTVIGFYLLLLFSKGEGAGLAFTFPGLVIGSVIYSLPFMVHPLQNGFRQIPRALHEASYVLGKSKWETLLKVLLPNMKPAIVTGVILSFAHTIGEFGVVLMIGGNIPSETRVASIAIFDQVESLNYGAANTYSLILIGMSFLILLLMYSINGRTFKWMK